MKHNADLTQLMSKVFHKFQHEALQAASDVITELAITDDFKQSPAGRVLVHLSFNNHFLQHLASSHRPRYL